MPLRRAGLLLGCLALCSAIQYTHLDSECAFYLDGAGRTTLYDYSLNLLRGPIGFGAAQPCITFDAINQAYIDARKRIPLKAPAENEEWMPHHVGTFGELLLDITKQLTRTYGLTVDEVEKGLPLIDTSKTLIKEVCPPYLGEVECRPGKYRRLDGLCNNVRNPTWGAANTPFTRLVSPQFADGIDAPRASVLGHPLPIPRIVSRTMHPDEGFHDHAGTVMVVAWGQFMDHDFTLTATPLDPRDKNEPEECCKRPAHLKHPYCLEIEIPDDDYFYHKYGVKCQDFVRSFPAPRPGCKLGSKVPYNTLTGVIDGNTVYGVTDEFGRRLRSGYGGQLRMNPVFSEYGLKDLLPLKLDVPDEGCTRTNASQFCFEAGEIRVNEQLVLTCMHTLMAREHNRIAAELATINPHWDDETLYQESRRIVIAEIQHITFNEFLPIILGKEVMQKFDLIPQKDGYWDGYDTEINPNIIDAFSAAAFRFGHSLLPTAVERWSKAHKFIASKRLSDLIRRPYDLYRAGVMDEYFMGLMNQVAQAMDDSITQEVTNHLLKKPGNRFGLDLVAFNMQRGREFGVPGYMEFRKFCGLPAGETFEELFGTMPNTTVFRYLSIFDHPSDVDLWSGGVSERPLPGSMIGPTFACIIATQMSYIRRGDRFWYELPNQPSSFTPEQLQEIRKIKLSRVICDNTDLIDTIQIYPMVLPDHEINPRVPCKSSIIPSIDLTKWAEFPHGAESQHVPYLGNGETSAILKDFDNRSTLRDCGNSTTHSKCLALIGVSIQNLEAMLRNSTDPAFNFGVSSKDNFSISHEDLTNKLRRKRNSKNDTFNSMNTNQREYKSGNVTEVLADSSYVNPVLERAPLPYTDLKDKTKPGNQKSKDMATAHNHRLGTQEKVKKQKNSEENSTDNIHSQPSKPKYVFAPVTPTLKKYKVIQRKPDSKFQESSPPQVIYSDESDDSLFDYIEDMRTKNTNLYPYKFPDFNFPNLNHASFNFDDSDEDSEGVRGGEDGLNDQEEKKGGKQTPQIIDAHDSHDMEHEYVASEEGVESEKREKTQQPENDNDDEDTGEEEEEGEGEGNDDDYNEENNGNKNKQEAEEDEEYADEGGNGEQKSEEETQSEEEEEEEENKEDEGNEEHERAKNLPNNNYHHIPAQGPESTWRPNGFPINYRPSHNSQLQNNVGGGYDIPVTRYPYSSTDDIKQDFISHPLAGPTASKGFNHDFTPLRGGRPLTKGPFGVEPPHKYPIVPLFDKNTLHKPLSTTVPAGPVSPINLSGFNGYKHFVAPLVSAEDQTPFNEYNNPRQSGSRYRETYRGGSPHGQKVPKAHRGRPNAHVKDEKVVDEEIEEEKEDEFPLEGVKEDDDNLHYPDFDDFHLPTNPYIIDNSSNTQSNINHRIKPSLSTNNSPNNFNFLTFEDKNQHNSNNYQRLKPNIKEEDPNYYQTTYSKHPDHYSKTKSTFNPHPKQSSTSSKNKFPVHDGNGQPSKPFLDKLQGGYIENPAIQESGKYDYPYGSEENGHRPTPEKNSHPSVDGASNPSNYPTKTSYEDYSFPKNINYHNLHYPTIKSNHKNYDGLKEITKYDKFENYPAVNDSSFEFHPQDSNGPHVDFKSQSVPYNFTSGVFGDLTDKQKYYNSMKNTNPFDKLLTPSSDSDNGKDSFPNGYKYPFSTNEHYQNAHDSTKRPSDTHYGHYNVPPYESISNYRNKNSGDLSPTQSLKGYDMFGNLHEKYKNHKPNKPINKKRNKSKLKKKSRGKKNNSNSNLKTHQNRPKTNSKKYIAQDVMNEDTIRDFDTIPNPSTIPLGIFGHNRLESDFAGTGTGNTDSERSNVPLLPKILNTDQTEIRLPKKSIYDLHGLYHRKNYKASDKSDDNHNMRAKFMGNQDKNILGTGRATSRTNPTGFYYDSPDIKSNGELRDKHVPLGYSYDEELDEPSTEAPEVVPRFVGKVSGKNNRAKDVIFEKGESNSLSKKELVDTLNKILDKKDAISREKNINENGDKLGKYSNYWVLEYSMPTE